MAYDRKMTKEKTVPSEHMMVAATLACEARRQQFALNPIRPEHSAEVVRELLSLYRYYLKELEKPENQPV
jgi:hypothetical protein